MRQHRTDAVSLVFGVIFLIIAGSWALGSVVDIDLDIPNLGWLLALGLVGLGLVGVVASLRRSEPADTTPGADQSTTKESVTTQEPGTPD